MITVNNLHNLGDKVFVITRDKNKRWFVPKASYKIILINIQVFGHLNPPPMTQIFYKIPNEYSKRALYPEARVFRDYECATTHCDVLNEYNPIYIGINRWDKKNVVSNHKKIIDEKTFNRANHKSF